MKKRINITVDFSNSKSLIIKETNVNEEYHIFKTLDGLFKIIHVFGDNYEEGLDYHELGEFKEITSAICEVKSMIKNYFVNRCEVSDIIGFN